MVLQTRWAVLLCKFKDDQSEPPVPNFKGICERFFTIPSSGYNAFQFFSDMSHGNIDLSGSQVFDWLTINANVSDALPPTDPPPPDWRPRKSQWDLMELAKEAATNAGADMRNFFGSILIMNLMTGWAQGNSAHAVWADWRRIDGRDQFGNLGTRDVGGGNGTEVFGQEMGHGYGLNHSYREGSNLEYQDPWDIMSTFAAWSVPDAEYCARGPGLNAWNMLSLGWLDESRVWRRLQRYDSFNGSLQLKPLHRRDLLGYLAIRLPAPDNTSSDYLLEFRIKTGWDEGIPRSAVLAHQFENGHSVIMKGTAGQYDLAVGDSFERPPYFKVQVTSIDEASQTATLQIAYSPPDKVEECTGLKDSIGVLDMEIQDLEREFETEEDLSRKQKIQWQLRQKRFQRGQLNKRFRDLGCSNIV